MNGRLLRLAVSLAFLIGASLVALGQRADQNTGGPTKNTLVMKIVEPAPNATITGDTVRVAVGYNQQLFGQGQGTRFGDPNFPQPRFDVYLDNDLKATLKGTESNVTLLHGVAPGIHKITVVAINVSGEVIDRKELEIWTVAAPVAMEQPQPEPRAVVAPPPAPQPAPEPQPAAPEETVIPKTASSDPALALAGLALVALGLVLRRRIG